MEYDGDDGRSHRNMKQEVHPPPTYEMGALVQIVVVFFAASSKDEGIPTGLQLPEGGVCAFFNLGPPYPGLDHHLTQAY